jgi:outer membrane protein assembly factor BamB
MRASSSHRPSLWLLVALLVPAASALAGADWPEWRGPDRTGMSRETGLPASWSAAGENLAWRVPVGGRSSPVVFGDRLYLQTTAGAAPGSVTGANMQERLICLNADTGKQLWEHKYNIFTGDVPPHRIAWSSPAVDPQTGNVYAISGGGLMMALARDGKLLWERSLAEEFGMWTTHGGRMSSPIVDGNQVIVSGLTFTWDAHAGGAHRFLSLDKATGQALWYSAPEGRPTDTIYANPYVATVEGVRMFFSGGSDGAMHAIKVNTGEPIWNWPVSKRGLNTAALMVGPDIIVTHSEENVPSSQMGMIAAVPAASKGPLTDKNARWLVRGPEAGYASPVSDGERIYVVENGGVLMAFSVKDGAQVWRKNIGTIQKSSPVLADGKLYVGTENGKFFVLRPKTDGVDVLDEDWMGSEAAPEAIIASPAVARGRIYVTTMAATYAIGPKTAPKAGATKPVPAAANGPAAAGTPATLLVTPTELLLKPGETIALAVRAFDANANPVPAPAGANWTLENLKGTLQDGKFTADKATAAQAGLVKVTAGGLTGASRIRVFPDLPWTFDFEDGRDAPPPQWVNATGKFAVRDLEGNKVLVKLAENPFAFAKRARPFFGSTDFSNYTIEADVRTKEVRRQMADVGVVAQRYEMVLFGNHQRLELQPWQPETERTVKVPFKWDKDTWYVMKLEVQALDGGKVRAHGKVWKKGEAEPAEWTIERVDPIGNLKGSPGLYADAMNAAPQGGSEIYYDNIRVYPNGGGKK